MKIDIQEIIHYIDRGEFGLEKESLRIRPDGFISETDHPFEGDPRKDRDFCESQVELITDVGDSVEAVSELISQLHQEASEVLLKLESGPEYLWPFSNPPYVDSLDRVRIAEFTGDARQKTLYRQYLAEKYGKKKMLYSGIHLNISFASELLEQQAGQQGWPSVEAFRNALYLDLAEKILEYSWLIVYLTAASPVLDGSFVSRENLGKTVSTDYASMRMSRHGYWNAFSPVLDFRSIEGYTDSIDAYVKQGLLAASSELYYPVRIKPKGANSMENLRKRGANHVELRMLDLNPLSPAGIDPADISFIYLLILYLLSREGEEQKEADQLRHLSNIKEAARLEETAIRIRNREGEEQPVISAAEEVLLDMKAFYEEISGLQKEKTCGTEKEQNRFEGILDVQLKKVRHPEERYAKRVLKLYGEDYVKKGIELVRGRAGVFSAE